MEVRPKLVVYTDGSCKYDKVGPKTMSTGSGGWAWYVHDYLWDSGHLADTTSARMEMLAVLQALRAMVRHRSDQPLLIVSDSAYVVNCFAEQWYVRWMKNDWKNSSGDPVANRDYWESLIDLYLFYPKPVTFRHCRGHGRGGPADAEHVRGNGIADRLAGRARQMGERRRA